MTAKRVAATAMLASLAICPASAENPGSRIKTPFRLVSLWSDEMMAYLTGMRQQACSGGSADAVNCRRIASGVCDGTAYFKFLSQMTLNMRGPARALPAKQTESSTPQYFELQLWDAGYGANLYDFQASKFDRLEMAFNCSFSGNNGCPAGRFQTGRVRRILLGRFDGAKTVDVTSDAQVLPDGPIIVPVGDALKASLFSDVDAIYQVRAVAECFSVEPSPVEWTLPVYEGPSTTAASAGTIIVRVDAGAMDFRYRSVSGREVPFTPDWVEPDWGYTFEMDLTVLERKGDWYQLPPRPFADAVWIQLPRRELDEPEVRLEPHAVYTLSKTIHGRRPDGRAVVFAAETNIFVVAVRDRALEIRKEESFDSPCEDDRATPKRTLPTYVVNAEEFYDSDLHLQLREAYTRGC